MAGLAIRLPLRDEGPFVCKVEALPLLIEVRSGGSEEGPPFGSLPLEIGI